MTNLFIRLTLIQKLFFELKLLIFSLIGSDLFVRIALWECILIDKFVFSFQ